MILDDTFLPTMPRQTPAIDAAMLVVGAVEDRSHVAGPGVRSVVWVAGCHRRCPGCLKPELFAFDAGRHVSIDALSRRLADIDGVDGVTFSGGEPFEQPLALAALATRLRAVGRNVTVYTGYRYEDLVATGHYGFQQLLEQTDILIDGEFRAEQPNPGRWRGSANQRLLALSATGRQLLESEAASPALEEIQVSADGTRMRLTGCPDRGFFYRWLAEMEKRGLVVTPEIGSDEK